MVPLRFFRNRAFSAANVTSLLMSFGMFGSIFLLAQFFQVVQGYSPLEAGIRTLPWTAMPIFVAPIAGMFSDRIGARPLLVAGMALMAGGLAWMAIVTSPTVAYMELVPAFVMAGVGMSLYFAPVANLVLSTVRRKEEGKASGVNNTIREVGGVFGVAVLASVFSAVGGYLSPQSFVDGMTAAVWVGAVAVALAGVAAVLIPPSEDVVPDSVSLLERGEREERGRRAGLRAGRGGVTRRSRLRDRPVTRAARALLLGARAALSRASHASCRPGALPARHRSAAGGDADDAGVERDSSRRGMLPSGFISGRRLVGPAGDAGRRAMDGQRTAAFRLPARAAGATSPDGRPAPPADGRPRRRSCDRATVSSGPHRESVEHRRKETRWPRPRPDSWPRNTSTSCSSWARWRPRPTTSSARGASTRSASPR